MKDFLLTNSLWACILVHLYETAVIDTEQDAPRTKSTYELDGLCLPFQPLLLSITHAKPY